MNKKHLEEGLLVRTKVRTMGQPVFPGMAYNAGTAKKDEIVRTPTWRATGERIPAGELMLILNWARYVPMRFGRKLDPVTYVHVLYNETPLWVHVAMLEKIE